MDIATIVVDGYSIIYLEDGSKRVSYSLTYKDADGNILRNNIRKSCVVNTEETLNAAKTIKDFILSKETEIKGNR